MRTAVRWYRLTCFHRPRGPWRDRLELVHKDALALGLGSYDEWGQWFWDVAGGVEKAYAIEDVEDAA